MSWGYVVMLDVIVPRAHWEQWQAFRPTDFTLPDRWPSKSMAGRFQWETEGKDSFAKLTAYRSWIEGLTVKKGPTEVSIQINTVFDRSLLYMAGLTPCLLWGAVRLGGRGRLHVVSDGTADEPGWEISVQADELVTRDLTDDEEYYLLDESLAGRIPMDLAPVRATPKSGRRHKNPVTGLTED